MRVVIQRVNHAQVNINGKTVGKIGKGDEETSMLA